MKPGQSKYAGFFINYFRVTFTHTVTLLFKYSLILNCVSTEKHGTRTRSRQHAKPHKTTATQTQKISLSNFKYFVYHTLKLLTSSLKYIVKVSKAVPLHAMEALGGRGGIAPTHSRPRHYMG
jgi:hypothetical protein